MPVADTKAEKPAKETAAQKKERLAEEKKTQVEEKVVPKAAAEINEKPLKETAAEKRERVAQEKKAAEEKPLAKETQATKSSPSEKKATAEPKGKAAAEGAAARREIGELVPGPKDLDKNGKPLTSQNLKMRECSKMGAGRVKADFSEFMSECLKKD